MGHWISCIADALSPTARVAGCRRLTFCSHAVDYRRQRHVVLRGSASVRYAYVRHVDDYGEHITSYVARRFRERRQELGWSLADLAVRADVHRSTVHMVERGQRGITLGVAARVARSMQLSLAAVIGEAEREFQV